MEDQISKLPDDVLLNILSLLPLKDAGGTCVLSKNWKHTWSSVPILNFDHGNVDFEFSNSNDETFDEDKLKFDREVIRYLDWVDVVIASHKAPTIDEFGACYCLEEKITKSIDGWLRFAVEKRVKGLQLDFATSHLCSHMIPYNLPATTLSLCNLLTYLQLAHLDVNDEALEAVIHKCQALASLSIAYSYSLVDFKMSGQSPNLKSLSIGSCNNMNNLEIDAPNLISFYYFGGELLSLPLQSTPKLSELSIGGLYCDYLLNNFPDFLSCFSQSEVPKLDYLPLSDKNNVTSLILFLFLFFLQFAIADCSLSIALNCFSIGYESASKCSRLRILDVTLGHECGENLFCFISLIRECHLHYKIC